MFKSIFLNQSKWDGVFIEPFHLNGNRVIYKQLKHCYHQSLKSEIYTNELTNICLFILMIYCIYCFIVNFLCSHSIVLLPLVSFRRQYSSTANERNEVSKLLFKYISNFENITTKLTSLCVLWVLYDIDVTGSCLHVCIGAMQPNKEVYLTEFNSRFFFNTF